MTGAELKALIPDNAGIYIEDPEEGIIELMPEDLFTDGDGDIVIRAGDSEEDEDDSEEDEEEIEVDV
jgi:hypothetical protein